MEKVLDYGNQKYARLRIGEQEILAEVSPNFDAQEVKVWLSGDAFEVWQQEIDFRIC